MTFILKTAVRENVPLLIGLAGGTGSGKTLSAFKLAKGLSGGKRFAVIDTESGRAKAYADDFDFDHGELHAPFRPETYQSAITSIDKLNQYPVIVVDSTSHEYSGEGGILDWQEEELREMVERAKKGGDSRSEWQLQEANKMRSWIKPKMSHKVFMSRLLQVRAHLILCFRAESKTEMAKENGKTVIREKQGMTGLNGWFPICEKNMPYELTAYFLLMAEKPGVPQPIKLMEKHRPFFPLDKPITEEAGAALAAWAKGGAPAKQETKPEEKQSGNAEFLTAEDILDLETACADAGQKFSAIVDALSRKGYKMETLPRSRKKELLDMIAAKKKSA